MRWDLFCRVVDNFGDIGVAWRLARNLAARGQRVRLFADDLSPLVWMAGGDRPAAVSVHDWAVAETVVDPGAVVLEAFGCDPPAAYLRRMAARRPTPRWINLEYLSAERYVERSHRLPSPQLAGLAAGLSRTFFYPGLTAATGGLLREGGLLERRAAFDRDAWLAQRGWARRPHERVVLLFGYRNPALPALIDRLVGPDGAPALLLLAPGPSQQQALEVLAATARAGVRAIALPFVAQDDFDHLLWSAELNLVRGEDSLVRAIWAGAPFVWQLYAQADRAHEAKLEAFLAAMLAGREAEDASAIAAVLRWWNGSAGAPARWPDASAWTATVRDWRATLAAQDDLCSQLLREVGAGG